jgi:hypothetical protein
MSVTSKFAWIKEFIGTYVVRQEDDAYFEDGDPLLWPQYVEATDAGVVVHFSVRSDLDPESEEIQALIARAMAALMEAHPELRAANVTHAMCPN